MTVLVYALALTIGAPCEMATPVSAGAKASCAGILVPEAQAVEAIECMTVSLPACGVELDTARRKGVVEHEAFTAQIDALNTHIRACERAVIEASTVEARAWWDVEEALPLATCACWGLRSCS